ncbi:MULTISPECIES: MFS transporter [Mycolicibacterium]|uniref:Sugar transporter family protein n=1 Tax=Mycolicibacterium neoaurum TaxID=1795 RepID=A0AAV2WHW5_MYCNE|nr:MFS transporter [Mycolicibacterium neoaurum]TLH60493.1 MFS transporter [Mycolicibacterium neoaurum]CDQ43797.1 sugar transporter family protein [Mycolicibacterium neoaurum]
MTVKPYAQLTVLAAAAFVYVTAEILPVGALPAIAADLDIAPATVGTLLAGYALIAAVATLPLVRWTARWPRRRALLLTLVCLTVSQALSVLAPNFAVLSVARVLCALTHGLMWSVLAPIAVRLVPPGHGGRATTAVYAGTALALVAGNPMTALLSQAWGWRTAAAVVMVAAAAVTLAARLLLPVLPATTTGPTGRVSRRRWHRNRALATLCGLTLVGVSAHFMSYTYIAVVVGEVTGTATAPVLAGFGVAGLAAMAVFARPLDRWPRPVLMTALAGLVAAFAGLAFVAGGDPRPVLGVVGMLAWGAMSTALPPMLQSAAITSAPEDPDGASGLYVAMFQAGIVTGALAGGALFGAGGAFAVLSASAALTAVVLIAVAALPWLLAPVTAGLTPAINVPGQWCRSDGDEGSVRPRQG